VNEEREGWKVTICSLSISLCRSHPGSCLPVCSGCLALIFRSFGWSEVELLARIPDGFHVCGPTFPVLVSGCSHVTSHRLSSSLVVVVNKVSATPSPPSRSKEQKKLCADQVYDITFFESVRFTASVS
jgi:hypothetical protein